MLRSNPVLQITGLEGSRLESKAVGSWNFGIGGFSKSSSGNFKHHQIGNSERKGRTSVIEIPRFGICGILHPESFEFEEKNDDTKIKLGNRFSANSQTI